MKGKPFHSKLQTPKFLGQKVVACMYDFSFSNHLYRTLNNNYNFSPPNSLLCPKIKPLEPNPQFFKFSSCMCDISNHH
ncbi:unnamed protein product [Trifolium pratense]|uniref:Uncharacterized protein n=1 Tax=Trifolium pratense TaxID=57577 RepID=A0ACB0L3W7_TRIPR|nr:unnamed protein product [Trifolium pratense]